MTTALSYTVEDMDERLPSQRPADAGEGVPPNSPNREGQRQRCPRIRRSLFNFAAVLSLLLFVGNYRLWLRGVSGTFYELVLPNVGNWLVGVKGSSATTTIVLVQVRSEGFVLPEDCVRFQFHTRNIMEVDPLDTLIPKVRENIRSLEWFKINSRTTQITLRGNQSGSTFQVYVPFPAWRVDVSCPYWFLQLLFAIYPVWWLKRWIKQRKKSMN